MTHRCSLKAWLSCARSGYSGLTLPSSGRTTACHAWPSFHSGPCASCRCAPLMSNVRRRRQHGVQVSGWLLGSSHRAPAPPRTHLWEGCALLARRSKTQVQAAAFCRRAVLHQPSAPTAPTTNSRSPRRWQRPGLTRTAGAGCPSRKLAGSEPAFVLHQPSGTLWLVNPEHQLRAPLQLAAPFTAIALHRSAAPNPSIERTRNGMPRMALISFWAMRVLPLRAAHVKR